MRNYSNTMDAMLDAALHHAALQRDSNEGRDWNHVFTLVIFALFVGSLLAAIVVGTHSYRAIQGQVDEVNDRRLTLDLVSNAVRSCDRRGAIGVGEGPEGSSLVLTESLDTGNYETRFYLYEGNLVEEYAMAGTPPTPVNATTLAPTSTFDFGFDRSSGHLTITCDQGTREIALRSAQGGER
jgi:hypothetical protein